MFLESDTIVYLLKGRGMMVPGLWEVEINSGSGKNTSNSTTFPLFVIMKFGLLCVMLQISKLWSTTLTVAVTSFKSILTLIQ